MKDGSLPQSKQGKYAKPSSFLQDEDCIIILQQYLRANKLQVELATLTKHKNDEMLPELGYTPCPKISERTMMRWLQSLNISYRKVAMGIYIDGHEREDGIEYRQKFLAR